MNVILPAEATLDAYKAAYVLYKKHLLYMCNIVFAYPTKAFTISQNDVLINVHVQVDSTCKVRRFSGFADVMAHYGNPVDMRFLEHVPESIMFCFRHDDKTILTDKLFKAFADFEANTREAASVPELLSTRKSLKVQGYCIVLGTGDTFLCPDERLALFRSRQVHYVVFSSGDSYGVQRCISMELPSLSDFAKDYLNDDRSNWFAHRRGHLVVSKAQCAPTVSLDELVKRLRAYLQNQR